MYVFCVYPAMSKKSENLSDLNKKDRNKHHSSSFINVVRGVLFVVRVTLVSVLERIECICLSVDTISRVCGSHGDFRERGLLLTTIIKEDIETMVLTDYSTRKVYS
jgi:hypothetical protein